MEEHRLRVFENRVLWKVLGHKRDKVNREDYEMRSFIIRTPNQMLFRPSNPEE